MRQLALLILLTLMAAPSSGQNKLWTGDTIFWYKLKKEENKKIGVDEIVNANNLLTIRLSVENRIIELWTNDNKSFSGQQIYFTSSYDKEQKRPTKYFSKKLAMAKDTAQLLFNLISEYKILDMPTQDSIKGWRSGLDGMTYVVEQSTINKYTFKAYWTPSAFKDVPEAVQMTAFFLREQTLLDEKRKFESFSKSLPGKNCYRFGMSIRCPVKN